MPSSSPGGFFRCLQRSGIGGLVQGLVHLQLFQESGRYASWSSSFVGL